MHDSVKGSLLDLRKILKMGFQNLVSESAVNGCHPLWLIMDNKD